MAAMANIRVHSEENNTVVLLHTLLLIQMHLNKSENKLVKKFIHLSNLIWKVKLIYYIDSLHQKWNISAFIWLFIWIIKSYSSRKPTIQYPRQGAYCKKVQYCREDCQVEALQKCVGASQGVDHRLFFPRWKFFFHQHDKFFLTRIKGLRTEDVVHCTDCKAHWGILHFIWKGPRVWRKSGEAQNPVCHSSVDFSTFSAKPVFDSDFCLMILEIFSLSANPLPTCFCLRQSSQVHCTAACTLPTCPCTDFCLCFDSWILASIPTVPLLCLTLLACLLTSFACLFDTRFLPEPCLYFCQDFFFYFFVLFFLCCLCLAWTVSVILHYY